MRHSNPISVVDKRVIVIGGSGILGRAIAKGFLESGAQVAISGTTAAKVARAAREISPSQDSILSLVIDAGDHLSLEAAAHEIQKHWTGLDIMVNAAGGNKPEATVRPDGSFFDLDPQAIEQVMRLNFMAGVVLPVQVLGKMMGRQESSSSIINISSMAALTPLTRVAAYSAAKAAVDNITRWLAVEFAKKFAGRIRVNAIAPGFFLTEQNQFLLYDGKSGELSARGNTIIEHTPMGRFGDPKDLVGACLWLGSEASRFVTGTVIPVDGGFSAFSGV